MTNAWKKTMVYLGLAEEDIAEEQPGDMPDEAAAGRPETRMPGPHEAPVTPLPTRAPVTPLHKKHQGRNTAVQEMNEILTVHPRQYRDAQAIAESFREGIPVIINLSQMSDADARRLVDFASGLSQGLYGKIERVTSKVFLLSPAHISVSGDAGAGEDTEQAFFAQA
ncbi:MAG TPA: cell division protein SepF [Microbacteriaceae bacterium]|nr:cell division protein SepF [Microbacteriaceae bacterium]